MSRTSKNAFIYIFFAVAIVFGGFSAARLYAPGLYNGFREGINRMPIVKRARDYFPEMPPLLLAGQGKTGSGATLAGTRATGVGASGKVASGSGATAPGASGASASEQGASKSGDSGQSAPGQNAPAQGASGQSAPGQGDTVQGASGQGSAGQDSPGQNSAGQFAGGPGAASPQTASLATSVALTAEEETLADLVKEEEMRGVWIATVFSIDFPRAKDNIGRQKQELIKILDTAADAGLNTVFFQVRPHGDTFYKSDIFPWSEYLTGAAGKDPGYDPLAFLIEEAEKRGIRVHAWINPYRLTMGSPTKPQTGHEFLPAGSPVKNRPDLTMACGDGKLYLNPGEPDSIRLVVDGVLEIINKYNVDGIHFDDYFYPSDMSYDDSATYEKYGKPSGISVENWRRANTTALVKAVYEVVKSTRPGVEFGVSPSGIWQNSSSSPLGSDTKGFESYNRIFADARLWVKDGILDYIVPQIYWPIGREGADYDILARWWRGVARGTGVKLYIGHAAYQVGTSGAWLAPAEIGNQIALNRSLGVIGGSVFYGYSKIEENALGLRDQLRDLFFDAGLAQELKIAYPSNGSTINAKNSYIIGSADPRYPLLLDGKPVARTVSGYFSVYVTLANGKNEFVFECQGEKLAYTLIGKWSPPGSGGGGGTPAQPKVTQLDKHLVYVTKEDQTVVRAEQNADATRLQPLRKGVKGYVTAESNGYYLMDSGNWTYKPNVDILRDEILPSSKTRFATLSPGAKTIDIAFGIPYFSSYYVDVTESEITLTLHQTKGQPLTRDAQDPVFSDISYEQAGPHAVYRLRLKKEGRSYGYHIRYSEAERTLAFCFNKPPGLSATWQAMPFDRNGSGNIAGSGVGGGAGSGAESLAWIRGKPFEGRVIMLDPGHGGSEKGAAGPPGSRGKLEKDINLDLALALEKILKNAGADVRLTRDKDINVPLETRADMIREIKPDLAISLHRNSIGADKDISGYFGVLALYTHPQSITLATCLRDAIVMGTSHRDGGRRWQSLAMCRIEECPSVLLELGFISNPADYERMNRESAIYKEAQAITRGLIAYMSGS